LQPIQKSASGGEISRVVFSLKKILSTKVSLPTLVLDEIDTGVSGEIAAKMGQKMKEMAKYIQLIVITHLPQVASKGDSHFYVYKEQDSATSKSNIKLLSEDERVDAIAKMLSGEKTSNSALENAKELLAQ
jgi:DNA repair protein RecN (Recombination protein N)